jgi:hypothetical protein
MEKSKNLKTEWEEESSFYLDVFMFDLSSEREQKSRAKEENEKLKFFVWNLESSWRCSDKFEDLRLPRTITNAETKNTEKIINRDITPTVSKWELRVIIEQSSTDITKTYKLQRCFSNYVW